jgi:dihydropteroate synthase
VDTYKAAVAESALELGAEIINDPSGLTFDAQLARAVANHDAGLVLNHMRGTPDTWAKLPPVPDVVGLIAHDLQATVHRAQRAAIDRSRIVIDPGLGFGKRGEQNAEILARLAELTALDLPLLVGPSRKHFLKQADGRTTEFATAAAVTAAILAGAHMVRVHDVAAMRAAATVADTIARCARSE